MSAGNAAGVAFGSAYIIEDFDALDEDSCKGHVILQRSDILKGTCINEQLTGTKAFEGEVRLRLSSCSRVKCC